MSLNSELKRINLWIIKHLMIEDPITDPNMYEIFTNLILLAEKSAKTSSEKRPTVDKNIIYFEMTGGLGNVNLNIAEELDREIPDVLNYLSEEQIERFETQVAEGIDPELMAGLIQMQTMICLRGLEIDNLKTIRQPTDALYFYPETKEERLSPNWTSISLMQELERSSKTGEYIVEPDEEMREVKRDLLRKSASINLYIFQMERDEPGYHYDNETEFNEYLKMYETYKHESTMVDGKPQYMFQIDILKDNIAKEFFKSQELESDSKSKGLKL